MTAAATARRTAGRDGSVVSERDLFERILTALHAGVLDDSLWPPASGLMDELCETKGNTLVLTEGSAPEPIDIVFAQFCFRGERDEDLERTYFETYFHRDERVPRLSRLPRGELTPVRSLFSEDERKTSAVYNEFLPGADSLDGFIVSLDGPDGLGVLWAVSDAVDDHGWTSTRLDNLRALLPHIRQFTVVRQALADARALGASYADLLDDASLGVVRLNHRGVIEAANDRAVALLRRGDGLRDADGALRAVLPNEDAALQSLLARALPLLGGPGSAGSMRVSRKGGNAPLVVHVNPSHGDGSATGRGRSGALVLVVDPAWGTDLDADRIGELLGLTPAESVVATLYGRGGTIDEIAAATGRSRTTVKWHIRHIYAKQGISRQVELAQLVMPLAEVARLRR